MFRQGYTLIEILAVAFVITITAAIGKSVASKYGTGPGIGSGFLAAGASAIVVVLFYLWASLIDRRRLQKLREKYRSVYRVVALPTDEKNIIKPEGAEIKIGDYGWEAGPMRRNGLIYLQGLTRAWTLVWYAGFRPEQVERVATKSSSQYDYWAPYWAKPPPPPPCPFPVLERETLTFGIPHHSHRILSRPIPYPAKRSERGQETR